MPKIKTHLHKLKRINTAKKDNPPFYVYKCVRCTFFLQEKLCVGTETQCWRCNAKFNMESYNLRQARPRCRECGGKNIPLMDMPPPVVDINRVRREPPPPSPPITEADADKLVDKFLSLGLLKKVKK